MVDKGKKSQLIDPQEAVNQKAEGIGRTVSDKFGNDKKLDKLVKEESERIIGNREIKPKEELVKELEIKIAKHLGVEINDEIKVASKGIVEEARKWEMDNIKTVREYRKKRLGDDIVEGYKKANEGKKITEDQEKLIKEQADLVAETFYSGKGIENIRDGVLAEAPKEGVVPLHQAWTDTEGSIKLLLKTPKQKENFLSNFEKTTNGLSELNQPTGIRELTSANSLAGALKKEGIMTSFNLGQSKFLSLVDRIDTFSGGAIRRASQNFVSKIGISSSKIFASNGLKMFRGGFQSGFNALKTSLQSQAKEAIWGGLAKTALGGLITKLGGALAGLAGGPAGWIATAAKFVLGGLKKLGKKIIDGINNLVGGGFSSDDEFSGILKKKWFIPVVIIVFLLTGCMLQNNNVSTLVSPTKDDEADYTGEFGVNILNKGTGDFKIATCDPDGKNPNGNNRLILREIALSVVGKITYSHFVEWRQIGASPKWNTPVPQKWVKGKDKNGNPTMVLDEVWEAKRRMYPFYGLDCGGMAAWLWYQCMGENWNKPGMGDWIGNAKAGKYGLDEVHLESVNDLKIGDVFERLREESIPACQEIDKKTGKVLSEGGCHHFAVYIGYGDVIEEVGNGGDPTLTKIYAVTPEYVLLKRDHNAFRYPHTYRVTDVFKD